MSIDNLEIGRRLRMIRERKGMEQSDIAEMVGLSQSYISRVEKGQGKLMHQYIAILSEKLNTPLDYFLQDNTHIEHDTTNNSNYKTMNDNPLITYDKHKEADLARLESIVEQMKTVNTELIYQNRTVIDSVATLSRANENLSIALRNMSEVNASKKEQRKAS